MSNYFFLIFIIHFFSLKIIKIKETRVKIINVNIIPNDDAEPT